MRNKLVVRLLIFVLILGNCLQLPAPLYASSTPVYGINAYSEVNLAPLAEGAVYTYDYFGNAFNVMKDGNVGSEANDATSWQDHIQQTEVYWGLTFSKLYNFNTVDFTVGKLNSNSGGWYGSEPKVQVRYNSQWIDVTNQSVSPAFPDDPTSSEQTYTFTFDDMYGDAIRIIREPGQAPGVDFAYTNIRELAIYYRNYLPAPPTRTLTADSSKDYLIIPVYLDGKDGSGTTLEEIESFRYEMVSLDPNAKVTWAMTNNYMFDENNKPQIAKVLQYVDRYNDEIAYGISYANNMSLDNFQSMVNEFLYMYRYMAFPQYHESGTAGQPSVWQSIPVKYRPASVITNSINQQETAWMKDTFGIQTFMGWRATQYNVDQLTGDGSPSLLPYYSDIDSSMVPAQNDPRKNGTIMMNSVTVDPIGSRYTSGASRWTVHPADPLVADGYTQIETLKQYFENPYHDRNTLNPIFLTFDINSIYRDPDLKASWEAEMNYLLTQTDHLVIAGTKEFADLWASTVGTSNDANDYVISIRGNGVTFDGHTSDEHTTYLWSETKTERLILSKLDSDTKWKVIDFTDYDGVPAPLPLTSQGSLEDVSYITGRNFKVAPTAPLMDWEKQRINVRLQEIGFTDSVDEIDFYLISVQFPTSNYSVFVDGNVSLHVQGQYSDASTRTLTDGIAYSTSDVNVASVDGAGILTGHAPGTVVVTATYMRKSATAVVTVLPPPASEPEPEPEPELLGITSSLDTVQLRIGQSATAQLSAEYTDGNIVDVTDDALWLSRNPAVASVDQGRITVNSEGITVVDATYGGKTLSISVTGVKTDISSPGPELLGIASNLDTVRLTIGQSAMAQLTAEYTNGNIVDVTGDALWVTRNPAVASVDRGRITVNSAGTTVVDVTYGGKTLSISVTGVDPASDPEPTPVPELLGITSSLDTVRLTIGQSTTAQLSAEYTDGSITDVAGDALWVTRNPAVASVDQGRITANSAGTTVVDATYGGKTLSISVTGVAPSTTRSGTKRSGSINQPESEDDGEVPAPGNTAPIPIDSVFDNIIDVDEMVARIRTNLNTGHVNSFTDISGHWAADDINTAARIGVVNGYDDNTFKPDHIMTRAEFTVMIARAFRFHEDEAPLANFTDITDNWAKNEIQRMSSLGILKGYPDQTFRPNQTISRAEMVEILCRILNLSLLPADQDIIFTDLGSNWNNDHVMRLAEAGIIKGKDTHKFDPSGSSTRAEAVTMIIAILEKQPMIKELLEQ